LNIYTDVYLPSCIWLQETKQKLSKIEKMQTIKG